MLKIKTTSIFNIKSRPYALLGFVGLLMGGLSFFRLGGDVLDINLHDTYFVIATSFLCRLFAAVLLFLWSVYAMTNKYLLSKYLTWFHVIATLTLIIILLITKGRLFNIQGPPRLYYAFTDFENRQKFFYGLAWLYAAIFALFVLGQLCLLINLIAGLAKFFKGNNGVRRKKPE